MKEAQTEVVRGRIRREVRILALNCHFETKVKRWHPDKFHQKQGQRIKKEHKEEVDFFTRCSRSEGGHFK